MTLLDEVSALAEKHKNAPEKERLILKMAISLLNQIENPDGPYRVSFTFEEYERVPGRWEMVDGQLVDY
ncbi:MAG: hypothetical protein M3Y07_02065 [Acidobacteriota bacterium]|nr:hypothetical protein [Acidobacteriota bacterium]